VAVVATVVAVAPAASLVLAFRGGVEGILAAALVAAFFCAQGRKATETGLGLLLGRKGNFAVGGKAEHTALPVLQAHCRLMVHLHLQRGGSWGRGNRGHRTPRP
jgi:hypothetical protein